MNRTVPRKRRGLPIESFATRVIVPEICDVEWETENGLKHEAALPVRNQLHESNLGQTVVFVIHRDHVAGFIARYERYGRHIDRRFDKVRIES